MYEAAGVRHNDFYSGNCVHIARSSKNIIVLGSPQVFSLKGYIEMFLHDTLNLCVRQISQKLILH